MELKTDKCTQLAHGYNVSTHLKLIALMLASMCRCVCVSERQSDCMYPIETDCH